MAAKKSSGKKPGIGHNSGKKPKAPKKPATKPIEAHNVAGDSRLRSIVERCERVDEEMKNLREDRKEILQEARSAGYDPVIVNVVIRRRKMEKAKRDYVDAMVDLYSASLGDLDGTPLGQAAIDRLEQERREREEARRNAFQSAADMQKPLDHDPKPEEPPPAPPADPFPGITPESARKMGAEAASKGEPVTANPFPARDKRRASWDEGWCQAAESDGMGIPDAWRRPSKKGGGKKPPPDNDGAASDGPSGN